MSKTTDGVKSFFLAAFIILVSLACKDPKDEDFRRETQERFNILKEDLSEPPEVSIGFYWEPPIRGQLTEPPVVTCLTTEVTFDYPYIVAGGVKFHAYYWARTENQLGGSPLQILSKRMGFDKEKKR